MNKKEKVFFTILFLLIFMTLVTMAVGIWYTYSNEKNNNNDKVDVVVKNISLLMSYDNSNKIYLKGLKKGLDYNFNFSVTNDSTLYQVKYKLVFEVDSTNLKYDGNDFSYTLTNSLKRQDETDYALNLKSRKVPSKTTTLGEAKISAKQSHYYTLNIKYTGEDNDSIFIGNVVLEKAVD